MRLIDADNLNFKWQKYNKSQIKAILDFIDKQPTAYDIDKVIEDAKEAVAKAICIGCGYLKGTECTYAGQNCGTSKPMLEVAMKALNKLKAGDEKIEK